MSVRRDLQAHLAGRITTTGHTTDTRRDLCPTCKTAIGGDPA